MPQPEGRDYPWKINIRGLEMKESSHFYSSASPSIPFTNIGV
jgi:thermostable 8-oxoguanine DNA glycosylase